MEAKNACRVRVRNPEKGLWKDVGIVGKIILKWMLEKYDGAVWTGLVWFRILTSGGLLGRR
jgi:hypothetical protein